MMSLLVSDDPIHETNFTMVNNYNAYSYNDIDDSVRQEESMQVIAEVEEGENLTPNLQKQGQKEADEMLLS